MMSLNENWIDFIVKKYGPTISKLNLSSNGLTEVDNIRVFSNTIVKLSLHKNKIKDITPIGSLKLLLELNISENKIESIDGLAGLTKLEQLDLSGNLLRRLSNIEAIKSMNNLLSLKLKGNPICLSSTEEYPVAIFGLQPHLLSIDEWDKEGVMKLFPMTVSSSSTTTTIAGGSRSSNSAGLPPRPTASSTAASSSKPSAPSTPPPLAASTSLASPTSTNIELYDAQYVKSLQIELSAFREAFQAQEEVLSASQGPETAKYSFGMLMKCSSEVNLLIVDDQADADKVADKAAMSSQQQQQQQILLLEKFPYYRLLSSWRKKTLTCLMQMSLLAEQSQQLYTTSKQERQVALQTQKQIEAQVMKWSEYSKSLQTQCTRLQEELTRAVDTVSIQQSKQDQLIHEQQAATLQYQSIHQYLTQQFAKQMTEQSYQLQTVFQQEIPSRLHSYERRLQELQEKLYFVQEMLMMKEVSLRNSQATIDLTKRLQDRKMMLVYQQQQQLTQQAGSSSSSSAAPVLPCLSEVSLSAEAESLLKTIFRSLDSADSGYISLYYLWKSLLTVNIAAPNSSVTAAAAVADQQDDHYYDPLVGISHREDCTQLGLLLYQLLDDNNTDNDGQQQYNSNNNKSVNDSNNGDSIMQVFVRQLYDLLHVTDGSSNGSSKVKKQQTGQTADDSTTAAYNTDAEVTWGELLLLLIPPLPTVSPVSTNKQQVGLTTKELRNLQSKHLLGDCLIDFGVVPLQLTLPVANTANAANEAGTAAGSSSSGHQPSTKRTSSHGHTSAAAAISHPTNSSNSNNNSLINQLKQERKFLLSRLQTMSRSMTRQAEEMKAYFESELRQATIKEHRQSSMIQELEEKNARLITRYTESEQSATLTRERLEHRIAELDAHNSSLISEVSLLKSEQQGTMIQALEVQTMKYERVTQEMHLLTKEMSKKEVKCKTQERDLLRLQSLHKKQLDEIDHLQATINQQQSQLIEKESQHRQEMLVKIATWEEEKNGLLMKLNDCQAELLVSHRKQEQMEQEFVKQLAVVQAAGTGMTKAAVGDIAAAAAAAAGDGEREGEGEGGKEDILDKPDHIYLSLQEQVQLLMRQQQQQQQQQYSASTASASAVGGGIKPAVTAAISDSKEEQQQQLGGTGAGGVGTAIRKTHLNNAQLLNKLLFSLEHLHS